MAVTITKSIASTVQAITRTATATTTLSSEVDVSTKVYSSLYIDCCVVGENTRPIETAFIVQVSQKASGNDTWVDYQRMLTFNGEGGPIGAAIDIALTVGDTVIDDINHASYGSVERIIFLEDPTLANSEWQTAISGDGANTFSIQNGVVNSHTTSTLWYNTGYRYRIPLDLTAVTRLRVLCDNNLPGLYDTSPTRPEIIWGAAMIHADELDEAFPSGGGPGVGSLIGGPLFPPRGSGGAGTQGGRWWEESRKRVLYK